MNRWLVAAMIIALALLPSAALAAPGTPRGMFIFDPHMGGVDAAGVAAQPGEDAIAVPLDDWDSYTPGDIAPRLGNPIWHVYLRTAGGADGYSWQWIVTHFEGNGWGQMVRAHPEIEWTLVIGNEPTLDFTATDAWGQRWWMLAVYRELALNVYGHIDQAWRDKYPAMKWGVAVGISYDATQVHLQWEPGDGGIRDYYDVITCHLYGETSLTEYNDMTSVYNQLMNDPYTKGVVVNEAGINSSGYSMDTKVQRYRSFVNNAPDKLKGFTPFVAGYSGSWPQYSMTTYNQGQTLGDHWSP